jgi:hypothetical protein
MFKHTVAQAILLAAPAILPAILPAQETTKIVRPKEIDDVLVNPGIGFMTLNRFNGDPLNAGTKWTEGYPIENYPFSGRLGVKGQPMTTIAYFRVYWKFVEPEEGRYNWPMLDSALKTAHDRCQTLLIRVAPYGPRPEEDVPDWYRKMLGDETGRKFPDKWRTDPEDARYQRYWTRLVRELGRRYDGNPDLEAVDISIVGYWGEGEHTDLLSEPAMRALMDAYIESFRKTPLLAQPTDRRTNQYALAKTGAGWRADCLGDMRGVDGRSWCHMFDAYPEDLVNFGLTEAWKKGPVSLEACGVMQGWKNHGWDIRYIIEQSLKWHISSFNNKSSAVPEEWQEEVNRWLKKMGYRFALRKFTYPAAVAPLGRLAFTSWWENKGVAPCYRRFPLALRLKGAARTEVLLTDADIRQWLPGDVVYDDAVFVPADLAAGDYELALALVDPDTRRPKVQLAIAGKDSEGWYPLGTITVRPELAPPAASPVPAAH